jgi:hypothetical protein
MHHDQTQHANLHPLVLALTVCSDCDRTPHKDRATNTEFGVGGQGGKQKGRKGNLPFKDILAVPRKIQSYVGDWVRGFREGNGKFQFTNGCTYNGAWTDGEPNGPCSCFAHCSLC